MSVLEALRHPAKKAATITAVVAVAVAALIGGLGPVHADTTVPDGSIGTMVPSKTHGTWTDLDVAWTLDLNCPAGTNTGALPFLVEPGNERPAVADSTTEAFSVFKFANINYAPTSTDGSPHIQYSPFTSDNQLIPGVGGWWQGSTSAQDSWPAELEANHKYSLGLACFNAKTTFMPFQIHQYLVPAADGKAATAWIPLYTDANKNWSTTAPKLAPTVKLSGTADSATSITAAAEVDGSTGIASDTVGQIEFFSNGTSAGKVPVANGKASKALTGLSASTAYKLTAKFIADATDTKYQDSVLSAEVSVSTPAGPTPTPTPTSTGTPTPTPTATTSAPAALAEGGTLHPGTSYTVTAPAGTFTAGDTVKGEIHSTPIPLTETATAAADGSAVYTFTAPAALPAGAHQLILTGTPSAKVFTLNLTVPADTSATTDPAGTQATASALLPLSNGPFTPLTGWISAAATTPEGTAGLFGLVLAAAAAAAVGWNLLLKRRRTRQH